MRSGLLSLLLAVSSRRTSSMARAMSGDGNTSRSNILAESWSAIAGDYERVLVPRFAPWTEDALALLRRAVEEAPWPRDTARSSLVLCCGPGHELLPVAKILGASKVLGIDLAPGMIDVARRRIEAECREGSYQGLVAAEVGDAMRPPPGPHHVLFSAFGLQQLPDPAAAIQSWINVMAPGGICAFIYWPPNPPEIPGEDGDGPFQRWSALIRQRLGKNGEDGPWDEGIAAVAAAAGGKVLEDRRIVHSIRWGDAGEMFRGMSRAGPWHALRVRRGDDLVEELGRELRSFYPPGEALCHASAARLMVLRREGPSHIPPAPGTPGAPT